MNIIEVLKDAESLRDLKKVANQIACEHEDQHTMCFGYQSFARSAGVLAEMLEAHNLSAGTVAEAMERAEHQETEAAVTGSEPAEAAVPELDPALAVTTQPS